MHRHSVRFFYNRRYVSQSVQVTPSAVYTSKHIIVKKLVLTSLHKLLQHLLSTLLRYTYEGCADGRRSISCWVSSVSHSVGVCGISCECGGVHVCMRITNILSQASLCMVNEHFALFSKHTASINKICVAWRAQF